MPKILPRKILMVDFDHTLLDMHLSNELCKYPKIGKIKTSLGISVYDYKNELNENSKEFFSYAKNLISQRGISFNKNVIHKILEVFKSEDQKVAIVTYSPYTDIIYELVAEELSSAYNISRSEIEDKLKVVGGFPAAGQCSPNAKQEHILSALIAFEAVEKSQISDGGILEIFKDIILIDDSAINISRALACGMNAILVRPDGTLDLRPPVGPTYAFNIEDLLNCASTMQDSHNEHYPPNILPFNEGVEELLGCHNDDTVG